MKTFFKIGEGFAYAQAWLADVIMKIHSAQPHRKVPKLKGFNWNYVREMSDLTHFFFGMLSVSLVVTTTLGINHFMPWLNFSVLSIFSSGCQYIATAILKIDLDLQAYFNFLGILLLVAWRRNVGSVVGFGIKNLLQNLPLLALREEMLFRAGAEKWTLWERFKSSLSFGLMHFTMIIVPVSAALGIAVSGGLLIYCYIRKYKQTKSMSEALEYSSLVHTVANMIVLTILVALLIATVFM